MSNIDEREKFSAEKIYNSDRVRTIAAITEYYKNKDGSMLIGTQTNIKPTIIKKFGEKPIHLYLFTILSMKNAQKIMNEKENFFTSQRV